MIAYERRAATVLYRLLAARRDCGLFLVPANVCPIVPFVLLKAHQPFELVDIDPNTLCIDENSVLELWRRNPPRYGGLLFVRTYGAVHDTSSFFRELRGLAPGALIIDDCCLCAPQFHDAPPPNVDAQIFSTGYAKYVDIGGGGYGVLASGTPYSPTLEPFDVGAYARLDADCKSAIARRVRFTYEDSDWLDTAPPVLGWEDYRLTVAAELARIAPQKAAINAVYHDALPPEVCLPERFQHWRFNILVHYPSDVLRAISDAGLFASRHYASLAGVLDDSSAPNAEALYAAVINLFNDRYFSYGKATQLAEVLIRNQDKLQRAGSVR